MRLQRLIYYFKRVLKQSWVSLKSDYNNIIFIIHHYTRCHGNRKYAVYCSLLSIGHGISIIIYFLQNTIINIALYTVFHAYKVLVRFNNYFESLKQLKLQKKYMAGIELRYYCQWVFGNELFLKTKNKQYYYY